MSRIITGACLLFAGCTVDASPMPSLEGLSACESLRASTDYFQSFEVPFWVTLLFGSGEEQVLDEIPNALQFVLDNRDRFVGDDHPLQDVQPGQGIDAVEALNGCWARFQTREFYDGSSIRTDAEAVIIDLQAGNFITQQMTGVEGNDCLSDSRPYIIVFAQEILSTEADHLMLKMPIGNYDNTIAGVDPDGRLSDHGLAALSYGLSEGNEYERSFTVDGDFLITTSDGGDGGAFLDATERWFRFACPE